MTNHDAESSSAEADEATDLLKEVCREAHKLLGSVGGPVRRVSVQAGKHRVLIEWDPTVEPSPNGGPATTMATGVAETDGADEVPGRMVVTAPLVGTFYRSAEPGAKPFVEEGDIVEAEQTLAIIEAMKIMNQIPSEVGGRVTAILVDDGVMVEFGQPLMHIDPPDNDDDD